MAGRLMAGVALLALASAPVQAQDGSQERADLEARIAALEAMLAELRDEVAEVRAHEAEMEDRIDEVELVAAADPGPDRSASAIASGFMAGPTRISYGGFIDLDMHATEFSDGDIAPTSIVRDFHIPGATPIGGSGDGASDFDATAQGSRFYFSTETPTDFGPVRTRLEMDFLGSVGGNERVSNSYNPRLRRAYVQAGNWLLGQEWTTFQNTSAIPESASFLVMSDGMVFVRQAQVRYTNGGFQFALENPDTTVTPFGGGGRIDGGDGAFPDVVARYNFSGEYGNVSVSALGRSLDLDIPGVVDGEAFGWGAAVQGRLNLGPAGSDLRFTLVGGEGLGRYVGLNSINGAVITANGDVEAIPSVGGLIAYRHDLGQGRRFNIGYSTLVADNDVALTGMNATRRTYSAYGAYLVTIAPGLTLGGEVLFGERELESGQTGSITRATFSTKFAF